MTLVLRGLPAGNHPFLALVPGAAASPALARVCPSQDGRGPLLARSVVQLRGGGGQYCFVDVETPRIVLSEWYYAQGNEQDLYLDLLHELTHLRQLEEGWDLWDQRFPYVERPTEVEGFAVAVEEGRRLGMTPEEIIRHLSNPWSSAADVELLLGNVDRFLTIGILPNYEAAKVPAPRVIIRPW